MAKTRRARIDTENGHRQATMLSLRIIVKETRCYTTSYLRAPSGTIEHERGSREVCYDEAIILHGCWLPTRCETFGRRAQAHISGVTAPAHCPRCSRHSMRIRGQETPKPDPRGQRSPRRAPLGAPSNRKEDVTLTRDKPNYRSVRTKNRSSVTPSDGT